MTKYDLFHILITVKNLKEFLNILEQGNSK